MPPKWCRRIHCRMLDWLEEINAFNMAAIPLKIGSEWRDASVSTGWQTMDTVRSETSEGSLASSRLDDGSGTSRSFSLHSNSSRVSIDSASMRSDYLSNFERKFLERKAAKHKHKERAKRAQAKADRQQLLSADEKRKAQREAERQARRREMEHWLTDPRELRRIELRSQKRSRDRMRALQEWYTPAISGATEEVQPVFVAAMNQEHSTHKRSIKPLLPTEAAAIKDKEDREAFQVVLQRQLGAFTSKLEYLEQFTDLAPGSSTQAKMRARHPKRRRRVEKDALHLAPLPGARGTLQASKSLCNHPPRHANRHKQLSASASLELLRSMSRSCTEDEEREVALDNTEVEEYLMRHRKGAKQIYAARKIQAAWRMHLRRRVYLPWRQRRMHHRRAIFEIWVMTHRVGNRAHRSLMRKYFNAWYVDVGESIQLREMELHLFRQAATQKSMPRMVINLVFTSDWERDGGKKVAASAATNVKNNNLASSSKAAFLDVFLSSAFAGVESPAEKGRSRVFQLRAQHQAAREEVRKKVVQHVFLIWKRLHEAKKRVGINAQLCLKRAVRMAFGSRQRWPAEILLAAFDIWARWAAFNRCKRLGLPMPHYGHSNPHWDIWLHNYQERQVRCVKAAAKAPAAKLRRFFFRLRVFARRAIRQRRALATAVEHFARILAQNVLRGWRESIADSAAAKKITRGVLMRFHQYVSAKRKHRPLKLILYQRQLEWFYRRAWRAWQRVHLHAVLKRELTLVRLKNSPVWRSRLRRTLALWRGERDKLVLWHTFEAWMHIVRKRKLFLTMQMLCARQQRRNLLFSVFIAWKSAKWDRVDGFLEDSLRLDAWDAYKELSAFFPMLFYGAFSDAASIFGGLPSHTYGENAKDYTNFPQQAKQEMQELQLATSGDAVRNFHGVLMRNSVVDVRNTILKERYLVNAIDDASGNTALHVAAQIEEPVRRLDILALLLSEGATTLNRANRHGLTPIQLAPDSDTSLLLREGIYAFYSRNILDRETMAAGLEDDHRLLWCVFTLMSKEWVVNQRVPADVHTGQWHSSLREELWLRQKHIRFASDSIFGSGVARSRGLLNALKARLTLSHDKLMHGSCYPHQAATPADSIQTGEQQYYEWEPRTDSIKSRASETGEYEAYARYVLATTLDAEACEQALIPSFVGLLFSLDFPVDEVLAQAYRYEVECTTAEFHLWELFQRIQKAEAEWVRLLFPTSCPDALESRCDIGLLRLFSSDADADVFFRKELFLLHFSRFSTTHAESEEANGAARHLAMELSTLLPHMQRKLRKAEKLVKRVQGQIDESERACRAALFTNIRRVEEICAARMGLEHARLRMAKSLIKLSDIQTVVTRLEVAKRMLHDGKLADKNEESGTVDNMAAAPLGDKKTFLETEMNRYSRIFEWKERLEGAHNAAKRNAEQGSTPESKAENLPEPLYQLQKEAASKLHSLFVLSLFRSCCCWLAEHMLAAQDTIGTDSSGYGEDQNEDQSDDDDENNGDISAKEATSRPAQSSIATQYQLAAVALLSEGVPQRRSSILNTRRVVETYHRDGSSLGLFDPVGDTMLARYSASADLLFEEERRTAQEAERAQASMKKVEAAVILEQNPVTGQIEMAPDHVVSLSTISSTPQVKMAAGFENGAIPRNRKKEELQRAMIQRKFTCKPSDISECDNKSGVDMQGRDLLPVIHGTEFNFGNFVTGGWGEDTGEQNITPGFNALPPEAGVRASATGYNTDAMWKRGGVKPTDRSAPSIKDVLANAQRLNASREKTRPGSRRQGLETQMLPVLPQQPNKSQETDASSSKNADLPASPSLADSNTTEQQKNNKARGSDIAERPPLERPLSVSSLAAAVPISPTLEEGIQLNAQLSERNSSREYREEGEKQSENSPKSAKHLCVPAVQINTRIRQNSAGTERTGRESSRVTSAAILNNVEHQQQPTTRGFDFTSRRETRVDPNGERQSVVTRDLLVSLSPPDAATSSSGLPSNHPEKEARPELMLEVPPPEADVFASSTDTFTKWTTAFEDYPLTDKPVKQLQGDANDRHPYTNRIAVPCASSFRTTTSEVSEEAKDFLATHLAFTGHTDTIEKSKLQIKYRPLALHGKSVTMANKSRSSRRKLCNTEASVERLKLGSANKPIEDNKDRHSEDPTNPPSGGIRSLSLTPSISVTVVTKSMPPDETHSESMQVVSAPPSPELPPIQKPPLPSPKPYVKLDNSADGEEELNSRPPSRQEFHLEGLGLNSSTKSLAQNASIRQLPLQDNHISTSVSRDEQKSREQSASLSKVIGAARPSSLATHQSRSRLPIVVTPPLAEDLTLLGARMSISSANDGSAVGQQTGFEEMRPLSQKQKERLWQEFAAAPLSTTVLDAYAILYPQSYQRTVSAEPTESGVVRASPELQKGPSSISLEASHLSARVDSDRQPLQKAIEQGRKFWSAVEGYRAIGSSSLVPVDAATIAQRRRDKAAAIYEQYFRGHENGSGGYHKPLVWLDMYPQEVAEVRRQLEAAPKSLFDEIQQSAELHISALLIQQNAREERRA